MTKHKVFNKLKVTIHVFSEVEILIKHITDTDQVQNCNRTVLNRQYTVSSNKLKFTDRSVHKKQKVIMNAEHLIKNIA